jgi:hypothetical protein
VFAVAPAHPLAGAAEPLSEATIAMHRAVVAADSSRRLPPRTVGIVAGQQTLTVPDLETKRVAQVLGRARTAVAAPALNVRAAHPFNSRSYSSRTTP